MLIWHIRPFWWKLHISGILTYFAHFWRAKRAKKFFLRFFAFFAFFDYFLNYRNVQATLLFTFSKQNITKQHFEAKMSKFYKWLSDFNTRDKYPFDYNSSSKTFWCQPCEQAVPAVQKSQLKQHLESEKHRKNLGLKRSLVQSRLEFQDPKKQCIS